MKYLHTMVRVSDLDRSLDFYVLTSLAWKSFAAWTARKGASHSSSLPRLATAAAQVELTYNWDPELTAKAAISATSRMK